MPSWIALFRGINVGGKHRLPMKELVPRLEALQLSSVRWYIQSGNVVFECPVSRCSRNSSGKLAREVESLVEQHFGFRPRVLILSVEEFSAAMTGNPFGDAEQHETVHFHFLWEAPKSPDLAGMEKLQASDERFALRDTTFYLHAPSGVGRSKLAASIERLLGVPATVRNGRTVRKIWSLAAPDGE